MKHKTLLIRLVVLVTAMMCALGARAAEAYACYTPENTTLTFYYDNLRSSRSGTTYSLPEDTDNPYSIIQQPGWISDSTNANVTKVVFATAFTHARPTTTQYWFLNMHQLQSINGIENLNTSSVTKMLYMFCGCSNLTNLDLSHFDTSNVTTMDEMFASCSSLTSLDLSNFNTSNVTTMYSMFSNCTGLTSLDLSNFNTSNVTTMKWMFYHCSDLTSLDLTSFNTYSVTSMSNMFASCSSLNSIFVSPNGWSTDAVIQSENMFFACTRLEGGKGTTYDADHVDKTYAHIDGGVDNPGYLSNINDPRPYACYTSSNSTLTFFYDNQRSSRPGATYGLNTGNNYPEWSFVASNYILTQVVFDPSFAGARPTSTYAWFFGMKYLESITGISYLNTSEVTSMALMFDQCKELTSLDLSSWNTSKVTTMELMFYNCINLTSIYVYNGWNTNMVNVSTDMFLNCTSLVGGKGTTYDAGHVDKTYARIDRGPGTPGYFRQGYSFCVDGIYYNITGSNTVDVASDGENSYSGIVTIPSSVGYNGVTYQVTGIGNDAFYNCSDLDSVSIPPTVTAIRHDAFYNCSVLEHVTLPSGLTTIGDNAFHLCWNLRDITIPDNVENIGVGAFMECSNLASVVIGNSVTTIGQQAFDHCTSLSSVVIPNSVTTIGKKAFYGCSNLENAVIGSGVTSIGSQAFYSCTNLRNITSKGTTPPTMASSDVFDNPAYTYATLFVPNGSLSAYQSANWWRNFTTISDQKFYDFAVNGIYYLITSGNTVEVSFRDAGLNTYSGNVTVPETVSYGGVTYQVTGIGTGAFANCANLTGVTLPSTVTYISDLAFMSCPSLGSVTLPNSLLTIGKRAFRDCTGLTSVTIPNSVTTIGERAFRDCTGLTSVTIPNSVTTIGEMAFDGCTGLTSVVIGSSVTFIGSYAFDDCDALRDVTCLASTPPVMENAGVFNDDTYADGTLTIPEASQSAYRSANWWKNFSHVSTFVPEAYACYTPENTTLTFYYDNQMWNRPGTSYYLNTATSSPGWSYSDAASVTQVVFDPSFAAARPSSTRSWFTYMENLQTIKGITNLNTQDVTNMSYMFSSCKKLTSLDLSHFNTSNVTQMHGMFNECSSLTSLNLNGWNTSKVEFMDWMFCRCSSLTALDLSSFNTSKVLTMDYMFYEISNLATINMGEYWSTAKVTSMTYMFNGCSSLTDLDVSDWNTGSVTNMQGMFWNCRGLTSLDLSGWNTSTVTDMGWMFSGCNGLNTIYVGTEWSTEAVTTSSFMFQGCSRLVGGMGTAFSYSNPSDKTYAHIDGGPSNPGYFTAKGGTALRGDVNGNNEVTIADVSALIDYLLTGDATGINMAAADCNGLDGVTIADVSALIDYLLTGSW